MTDQNERMGVPVDGDGEQAVSGELFSRAYCSTSCAQEEEESPCPFP